MKTTLRTCFTALALMTALTIPVQLAAQDSQHHPQQHHHYQLVDMGTFGGTQSHFTETALPLGPNVNNHGALTGYADTSTPDPFPTFPFADSFITHAFQWRNGVRTDLGILPNGWSSAPVGISANGLIAGFSQNGEIDPNVPIGLPPGFPELRAVLWQNGKITDLGVLPEGGYESLANAVNSRGQVVGLALNTTPDSNSLVANNFLAPFAVQTRAFLWDEKNGMQDLGTLRTGTDALANLINEKGQVVGWSYTGSLQTGSCSPVLGSFIWQKGKGMTDLGSFGGTCTWASGLNNRGQVVGQSAFDGDQVFHAFVWDGATGLTDLGTLGGTNSQANAINEDGDVVGASDVTDDTNTSAVLWQKRAGKWRKTNLGTLGGSNCAVAVSINESGQVVGGTGDFCQTLVFLWEDRGPMVDLNTLVSPNSGFYVSGVWHINDQGEITGNGVDASGNAHAVLLIPCDAGHTGVEGCDYSLVDADATTRVTPPLMLNVPANRMLRPFGGRAMPGQRGSTMW